MTEQKKNKHIVTIKKEFDTGDPRIITKPLYPKKFDKTCYGIINNEEWLHREKERIEAGTKRECVIRTISDGRKYLMYKN